MLFFKKIRMYGKHKNLLSRVSVYIHWTFYMIVLLSFSSLAEKKYLIMCDCIVYLSGEKASSDGHS